MKSAGDRVSYEDAWTRFVDSLEKTWTTLVNEGKQAFSTFQPWAGKFDRERKHDELLQYLVQSRHVSQHSQIHLDWAEDILHYAPGFNGHIGEVKVYTDGSVRSGCNPCQRCGQSEASPQARKPQIARN